MDLDSYESSYYKNISWEKSKDEVKIILNSYTLYEEDKNWLTYIGDIENIVQFTFDKHNRLENVMCEIRKEDYFEGLVLQLVEKQGDFDYYHKDNNKEIGLWKNNESVVSYELRKEISLLVVRYWERNFYDKIEEKANVLREQFRKKKENNNM